MTQAKFNNLIHAENRLQICAMLMSTAEVEFKVMRDALNVSDSVLSKHLKSLEDVKYIGLLKRKDMGRQRTWIFISAEGRVAYEEHIVALQNIVNTL